MNTVRRGGTLIELLVALVLLDLALLTLAAAGAASARRLGEAGRRTRAAVAASNRVESLSALPCDGMSSGSARLEAGVVETWNVRRTGSVAELVDSVSIDSRPAERIVIRRRVPCR